MCADGKRPPLLVFVLSVLVLAIGARAQSGPTTRSSPGKFIQTFLVYQSGGPKLTPADAAKLARFDILCLGRFRYVQINGNTYRAVRKLNPDIQIYLYQHGPDCWIAADGSEDAEPTDVMNVRYLNNIARYNNARGHSMGNLNTDNPDLFLRTAEGQRCHTYHTDFRYLLDFGSPKLHAYWLEATQDDILDRPWAADGVFVDNTAAMQWAYACDTPARYDTDAKWIAAMHKFHLGIAAGLHARGAKLWTNTCCLTHLKGYQEWLALDGEADPPDLLGEEGAFCHGWGGNKFYPEEKWKRQVDVLTKLNKCAATMFCHTRLPEGQAGIDQYGKPVSYFQMLYYALGSFLLGKNDQLNNAYFYFFTQAVGFNKIFWYDEYERIDLGSARGPYRRLDAPGGHVYGRAFERGYVYVNPTYEDVSGINLPQPCKLLTHRHINDDFATLPTIERIDLKSHHAAILLRADSVGEAGPE